MPRGDKFNNGDRVVFLNPDYPDLRPPTGSVAGVDQWGDVTVDWDRGGLAEVPLCPDYLYRDSEETAT